MTEHNHRKDIAYSPDCPACTTDGWAEMQRLHDEMLHGIMGQALEWLHEQAERHDGERPKRGGTREEDTLPKDPNWWPDGVTRD